MKNDTVSGEGFGDEMIFYLSYGKDQLLDASTTLTYEDVSGTACQKSRAVLA